MKVQGLQHLHFSGINSSEMQREKAFNDIDAHIIDKYLEILEDHSISDAERDRIYDNIEKRRDKMDARASEEKKRNSKRLIWILITSTLSVLGLAIIKYLPEIISALSDQRDE